MTKQSSRRDILKGGLTLAGLVLGMPEWVLPALAQGETLVPFTDLPDTINLRRTPERRIIDIRTIDGPFTPTDEFFTVQHYGHPVIDPATYRLRVSGVVDPATSLSIDELRKMPSRELVFGFECSGNRGPVNGLASNGRWTGVPLRAVLDLAGVRPEAREAVFFGADHGEEDVEFRGRTYKVDQQFGRSLPREKALSPEPLLAYALNGEPLTSHQGFPLRLLVPGWYGVANVKWLSEIHVQEDQYLGKYQARWYRTVKGEMIDGEMKWKETAEMARGSRRRWIQPRAARIRGSFSLMTGSELQPGSTRSCLASLTSMGTFSRHRRNSRPRRRSSSTTRNIRER